MAPVQSPAASAVMIRSFEAVLNDVSRLQYFMDFLVMEGQGHKLTYLTESEQPPSPLDSPPLSRESSTDSVVRKLSPQSSSMLLDRNRGPALTANLDLPGEMQELVDNLWENGCPANLIMSVVRAFVRQELLEKWFVKFLGSSSYKKLREHLCLSYPLNLSQLLVEGPLNDVIVRFLNVPGECPAVLRDNFHVYHAIVTSLKPLCASVFRALTVGEAVGSPMAHLLEETGRLKQLCTTSEESGSSCIDTETRAAIFKSASKLAAAMSMASGGSSGNVLGAGSASPRASMSMNTSSEGVKATVSQLGDALLRAQQQAYHHLHRDLLPALRSAPSFTQFADDMLSLESQPLQARLSHLNDMADVRRRALPHALECAVEGSSVYLMCVSPTLDSRVLRPAKRSVMAAQKSITLAGWKEGDDSIQTLKADMCISPCKSPPSIETQDKDTNTCTKQREGAYIDTLACVTAPQIVFTFCVSVEEVFEGTEANRSANQPAAAENGGLHGCLATLAVGAGGLGSSLGGKNPSAAARCPKILRRFRTRVRQLKHLTLARVIRPECIQHADTHAKARTHRVPLHMHPEVGLGLPPGCQDTDFIATRTSFNAVLLDLLEAGLMKALPAYCMPSVIAFIEPYFSDDISASSKPPQGTEEASMHNFVMCGPWVKLAQKSSDFGAQNSSPRRNKARTAFGDMALDMSNLSVNPGSDKVTLYGACLTTWRRLIPPKREDSLGIGIDATPSPSGLGPVWVPECTCALSLDPLFDTLRGILLMNANAAGSKHINKESQLTSEDSLTDASPMVVQGGSVSIPPSPKPTGGLGLGLSNAPLTLRAPPVVPLPKRLKNLHPHPGASFSGVPSIDFPLTLLFHTLSVPTVMSALHALMLERSVIISGGSATLRVCACEGLRLLLHPLKWQHAYAPLLPASEILPFWRGLLSDGSGGGEDNPGAGGGMQNTFGNTWSAKSSTNVHTQIGVNTTSMCSPFLVGMDAQLICAANSEPIEKSSGNAGNWVWGVPTKESCLAAVTGLEDSFSRQKGPKASAISPPTIDCVKRMLRHALHIDLTTYDVTLAPAGVGLPAEHSTCLPASPVHQCGAKVKAALFPELTRIGKVHAERIDPTSDTYVFTHTAHVLRQRALHAFLENARIDSKDIPVSGGDLESMYLQTRLTRTLPMLTPSYPIVHMYHTSVQDVQLRHAFLELMHDILGRVREFITLDIQQGLIRFDSHQFLNAMHVEAITPIPPPSPGANRADVSTNTSNSSNDVCEFYAELFTTRAFATMLSDYVTSLFDLSKLQEQLGRRGKDLT